MVELMNDARQLGLRAVMSRRSGAVVQRAERRPEPVVVVAAGIVMSEQAGQGSARREACDKNHNKNQAGAQSTGSATDE